MNRRFLAAAGVGLAIGGTAWLVYSWNEGRQASAEAQRWIAEGEDLLEQDLARGETTTDHALANRAIDKFRAALQLLGESSRARRGLGRAHLRRGEFSKAVEEYDRALAGGQSPASWKREAGLAYLNRYALSRDAGDLLAGSRRYEEALAADAADAEASGEPGPCTTWRGSASAATSTGTGCSATRPTRPGRRGCGRISSRRRPPPPRGAEPVSGSLRALPIRAAGPSPCGSRVSSPGRAPGSAPRSSPRPASLPSPPRRTS